MARFLTTKQTISELEDLIKKADKVLYLLSPYLKLSKDFEELINSRNKNKKETVIIYGKAELKPEQLKFLTGLRYVFLKFHENLHGKCYMNDSTLIITSLNFYEFSMMHNKEIGVLYEKSVDNDLEIYNAALDHIKFIEDNSDDKPFELQSTSGVVATKQLDQTVIAKNAPTNDPPNSSVKSISTSALSKELGLSSKELFSKFEKLKLIEKQNDDWVLTTLGKSKGAQMKKGQYGEYIAWPISITEILK